MHRPRAACILPHRDRIGSRHGNPVTRVASSDDSLRGETHASVAGIDRSLARAARAHAPASTAHAAAGEAGFAFSEAGRRRRAHGHGERVRRARGRSHGPLLESRGLGAVEEPRSRSCTTSGFRTSARNSRGSRAPLSKGTAGFRRLGALHLGNSRSVTTWGIWSATSDSTTSRSRARSRIAFPHQARAGVAGGNSSAR